MAIAPEHWMCVCGTIHRVGSRCAECNYLMTCSESAACATAPVATLKAELERATATVEHLHRELSKRNAEINDFASRINRDFRAVDDKWQKRVDESNEERDFYRRELARTPEGKRLCEAHERNKP